MSASAERRNEDLRRLKEMAAASEQRLQINHVRGNPMDGVDLTLHVPTAIDQRYPATRAASVRVRIELPYNYPYEPPACSTLDQVFNVNVFASGVICIGKSWSPTHQLSMTVERLWRIFSLDPAVINPNSPANLNAIEWWNHLLRNHRHLLPTATLLSAAQRPKPNLGWKPIR